MGTEFEIILNSLDFGPNDQYINMNTPASFTNVLNSDINLEVPYTVSLTSITYPQGFFNIIDCSFTWFSFHTRKEEMATIACNTVYSVETLLQNISEALFNPMDKAAYQLTFDSESEKIVINFSKPTPDHLTEPYMHLSSHLSDILGIERFVTKDSRAIHPVDLFSHVHAFIVSLNDVIARTNFGSSTLPILSIVPFESLARHSTFYFEPSHLHWCPLRTQTLNTFQVRLLTTYEETFPFRDLGQTMLTLKFRPLFY